MTTTRKKTMAKKVSAASNPNKLLLTHEPGKSDERIMAECSLSAVMGNAGTSRIFLHGTFGVLDINEISAVMRDKAKKVQSGDLSDVEATLTAQAATLDTIFNELARRGALNMGKYLSTAETYLRLALKAQSQCRSTLETLAEIKNPRPVAFVKQANIAHGAQQVNNGFPAPHAREEKNPQNKLLESDNGKRMDTGTAGKAIGTDKAMATVGEIDRAKNG